jgi:hypothetical protein
MSIKVTRCVMDKFYEDHDWSFLVVISKFDNDTNKQGQTEGWIQAM